MTDDFTSNRDNVLGNVDVEISETPEVPGGKEQTSDTPALPERTRRELTLIAVLILAITLALIRSAKKPKSQQPRHW